MSAQLSLLSTEALAGQRGADEVARLRERAQGCQACALSRERRNVVFGAGNIDRPLLAFVGEGPGAEEDAEGVPFVGSSGKLLNRMIKAMTLERSQVFITNAVLCRPTAPPSDEDIARGRTEPQNRKPSPAEKDACRPLLCGQLRAVNPQCIVAMGGTAAQTLLGSGKKVTALRGQWHSWEGVPVRATYHPAALLRNVQWKPQVWEDLQAVMIRLGLKRTKR